VDVGCVGGTTDFIKGSEHLGFALFCWLGICERMDPVRMKTTPRPARIAQMAAIIPPPPPSGWKAPTPRALASHLPESAFSALR
jgi:hypothetical protein